jgi:hypothetical protein
MIAAKSILQKKCAVYILHLLATHLYKTTALVTIFKPFEFRIHWSVKETHLRIRFSARESRHIPRKPYTN